MGAVLATRKNQTLHSIIETADGEHLYLRRVSGGQTYAYNGGHAEFLLSSPSLLVLGVPAVSEAPRASESDRASKTPVARNRCACAQANGGFLGIDPRLLKTLVDHVKLYGCSRGPEPIQNSAVGWPRIIKPDAG